MDHITRSSKPFTRAAADRHEVRGIVYVPWDPRPDQQITRTDIDQGVDTWGTFMRPAGLERLAKLFIERSRNIDANHDRVTNGGTLVESFLADDGHPAFPAGAWAIGVRASDDAWAEVERGELNAFSFDILASRTMRTFPVAEDGDYPTLDGVESKNGREPAPRLVKRQTGETITLAELEPGFPFFVSLVKVGANKRAFERRFDVLRADHQEDAMRTKQRGATPYTKTPVSEATSWDGDAAERRIRAWASSDGSGDPATIDWSRYGQAFAWVDESATDTLGAYRLPHHDVDGDHLVLVAPGLFAAGAAIQGARGGTSIPDADLDAVKAHLAKHYKDLDRTAPWVEQQANAAGTNVQKTTDVPRKLGLVERIVRKLADAGFIRDDPGTHDGTPPINGIEERVGKVVAARNRDRLQKALEGIEQCREHVLAVLAEQPDEENAMQDTTATQNVEVSEALPGGVSASATTTTATAETSVAPEQRVTMVVPPDLAVQLDGLAKQLSDLASLSETVTKLEARIGRIETARGVSRQGTDDGQSTVAPRPQPSPFDALGRYNPSRG